MTSLASTLFLAFVSLILSNEVRSRPQETLNPFPQTNSSTETKENESFDIRQQAIENFMLKVLKSLKMDQPPIGNLTNHSLSNKVIELLKEEDKEKFPTEPKENVMIQPSNNDFSCQRGNGTFCRKFDFNITSDLETIITVHAYFHKNQSNERLTLSVYDPESLEDDPLIKLREDSAKHKTNPEWISYELPKKLALKTDLNHLICSVETEGSEISTIGEEVPFLIVTKHSEVLERKRREVEEDSSNENCTCCADNYHVTLHDIGWENWVYAPLSFDIKVCRGECAENLSYFTLNYAQIIHSFYKRNKTLPRSPCNPWGPQCKAETLSSLNMIYRNSDGNVHEREMKEMIIQTCKCM